ncbi:sigma-70 family RNA polymerase sigma factor [Rhodocytophaga aerolata]|uniref:Sigma-70 family RNA polymerase sigma factor n=1 Tax=Rhodocytophaga aerolata TaxID=455078 RepID=A0ABT8RB43_9BACT|nr:sigma-70 family RNA polymerase sigma factor [Rhodocytophaga aerolata]MDO1448423.1 sigma-70 family RNA polymerase sigma factor [Rhodocytophaga aerolata]
MLFDNTPKLRTKKVPPEPSIEALRTGCADAYQALSRQCFPMVWKYIRNNHGSREDAIDLLQEAMVVLYRNLQKENFVLTCKASSYIYAVCRQNWLYFLRKQKLSSIDITSLVDTVPEETKPVESLTDEQLNALLDKLDQVSRQLLVLFYYQNKSLEEIAAQLNLTSANTVKVRKFRCLNRLKQFAKCM